ncbi:MAG: sensor histidine kinase [Coriobacteriales bacterium]|nr:sensor histidine kinase [Coriobacteriales bacterium]
MSELDGKRIGDGGPANSSGLLGFLQSVSTEGSIRVEENLGDGYVRLLMSEAERRQAKHDIRCVEDIVIELLRNSRDASARSIFLATTRDGDERLLTIIDDGCGIPESMHEAIFEPRVTSKLDTMVMDSWGVHGRGMALFSIISNVDEAMVMRSESGKGSAIRIKANTTSLPEKTDQSSMPALERDEDGSLVISKGPHNINRIAAEFAIACKHDVDVYLGSPAEIVATLIAYGEREYDSTELLFHDSIDDLDICRMLSACASASELTECALSLGLDISERTSHRILHGQIQPLKNLYDQLSSKASSSQRVDIYKDSRALKISPTDLETFSRKLEDAFESISEGYYMTLLEEPKIKVGKQKIQVTFLIDKE